MKKKIEIRAELFHDWEGIVRDLFEKTYGWEGDDLWEEFLQFCHVYPDDYEMKSMKIKWIKDDVFKL